MFATLLSVTIFFALAIQGVFADFEIDTPTFTQCQSANITWSASQPPYNLIIVSADDMCGNPLQDLGDTSATELAYTVNITAGTQVVLSLADNNGDEAWSGTITVQGSSDSSCLASSSSSASVAPTSVASVPTALPSGTDSGSGAPTTSPFAPAGAANAGINPLSSGAALTANHLGASAIFGSALAALFAFSL
ncbi:hypothetical protein SERLA73DRAFT_181617 [Serpula lacrymans var. lacrymans S7.3]|uniref:Uncharacterized protein n=2 Tax=Serpula lacrymans var. lacrymans TaxID=341189 RepID=F8PYD4_SERL3|nr:uncharacterized protein SERLADRAFT_467897 [Serpula lacrymans var. lacrymans S7.9]EGN98897.1 hypothetical protein SERLA73DRAFT_181617 [Serpula lacrymans var. lacrymans S7.3]EGO24491.1 hypothetical protein SERLADRAFT_467897 [Serpula lacrymans var. lacrymans S7.9]